MKIINNIMRTVMAAVIVYVLFNIFALIFAPDLLPGITGAFSIYWIIFKNFFAEDMLRTVLIALFVAGVFGTISYKEENLWIGLIGGIIDLVVLFAGLGN